jgi:signal transduction histidine kinase
VALAHLPGLLGLGAGLAAALTGTPPGPPWLWAGALVVGLALAWLVPAGVGRAVAALRQDGDAVSRRLTDTELHRSEFVAELLVNLARRSQGTVYRQLEILDRLQEGERDEPTLAELFRLEHLATRVQRTANNLLVLAGQQVPRTGVESAPLREVVRSAITDTEDVERVLFMVDEQQRVTGHAVADLAHLLAELIENAVRFSPPDSVVTVRSARPDQTGRGRLVTVEDWGVGFPAEALAEANALMAEPHEVDLSISQRLGLHVAARLAQRHGVQVTLADGATCGTICTLELPAALFEPGGADGETAAIPLAAVADTVVDTVVEAVVDAGETQRIPALPKRMPRAADEPIGATRPGDVEVGAEPDGAPATSALRSPDDPHARDLRSPDDRAADTDPGRGRPQRLGTPPAKRDPRGRADLIGAEPGGADPPGTAAAAPRSGRSGDGDALRGRSRDLDPGSGRSGHDDDLRSRSDDPDPVGAAPGESGSHGRRFGRSDLLGDRSPGRGRSGGHGSADSPSGGHPAPPPAAEAPRARQAEGPDDPGRTETIRVPVARSPQPPTGPDPRSPRATVDLFDPEAEAGPVPDDPTPTPAGGTPLAAALPHRSTASGRPGRPLPGPFGSTGSWQGWWEQGAESPSPVAASAPGSTGSFPAVPAERRPLPPVAAPPGLAHAGGAPSAPIAWVEPNPTGPRATTGPGASSAELWAPNTPSAPTDFRGSPPSPSPPAGLPTARDPWAPDVRPGSPAGPGGTASSPRTDSWTPAGPSAPTEPPAPTGTAGSTEPATASADPFGSAPGFSARTDSWTPAGPDTPAEPQARTGPTAPEPASAPAPIASASGSATADESAVHAAEPTDSRTRTWPPTAAWPTTGTWPPTGIPADPATPTTSIPVPTTSPETATDTPVLGRRVPRANLAPELRATPDDPSPDPPTDPPTDRAVGAAALSRYQASRAAARVAVSGDALSHPGSPVPPDARRKDDRSPDNRYDPAPSGESMLRTDHGRPQRVDEPDVIDGAGADRSTAADAAARPPESAPGTRGSGPDPAPAASGPAGTGENRAMDSDAGARAPDVPTPDGSTPDVPAPRHPQPGGGL